MVRHQAPCPDINLAFPAPFGHQVEIRKIVFITEERLLTTVTTLRDVMRVAGGHNPCDSNHVL